MFISKLDHQNQEQATQIWQLFQSAYESEAQVLGLQNFPPLNRTIREIQEAATTFYGGWLDTVLVAATELENLEDAQFHINSFGVSPDHFRKGYGAKLLNDVLAELIWKKITVSTAVANIPALALYQKQGFCPQEEWTTPDNIHMVTLCKETKI